MLQVRLPAVLLSTRAKRQVRGLTPKKSPLSYSYGHFRTKAGETVSHWLLMVPLADESVRTLSEPACNSKCNAIPTLSEKGKQRSQGGGAPHCPHPPHSPTRGDGG